MQALAERVDIRSAERAGLSLVAAGAPIGALPGPRPGPPALRAAQLAVLAGRPSGRERLPQQPLQPVLLLVLVEPVAVESVVALAEVVPPPRLRLQVLLLFQLAEPVLVLAPGPVQLQQVHLQAGQVSRARLKPVQAQVKVFRPVAAVPAEVVAVPQQRGQGSVERALVAERGRVLFQAGFAQQARVVFAGLPAFAVPQSVAGWRRQLVPLRVPQPVPVPQVLTPGQRAVQRLVVLQRGSAVRKAQQTDCCRVPLLP